MPIITVPQTKSKALFLFAPSSSSPQRRSLRCSSGAGGCRRRQSVRGVRAGRGRRCVRKPSSSPCCRQRGPLHPRRAGYARGAAGARRHLAAHGLTGLTGLARCTGLRRSPSARGCARGAAAVHLPRRVMQCRHRAVLGLTGLTRLTGLTVRARGALGAHLGALAAHGAHGARGAGAAVAMRRQRAPQRRA